METWVKLAAQLAVQTRVWSHGAPRWSKLFFEKTHWKSHRMWNWSAGLEFELVLRKSSRVPVCNFHANLVGVPYPSFAIFWRHSNHELSHGWTHVRDLVGGVPVPVIIFQVIPHQFHWYDLRPIRGREFHLGLKEAAPGRKMSFLIRLVLSCVDADFLQPNNWLLVKPLTRCTRLTFSSVLRSFQRLLNRHNKEITAHGNNRSWISLSGRPKNYSFAPQNT